MQKKAALAGISFFLSLFVVALTADANELVGYDENTEIITTGTIVHSNGCGFRQLHCFVMESNSRTIRVITAPHWFIERMHVKLRPGMEVRVVGSKFYGQDGGLYLVARSVKTIPGGRCILFRDRNCKPVWSRRITKRSSCMKIFFSPDNSL